MTAEIVCAKGHSGLMRVHTIAANGEVEPSVVCTVEGCGWHEFITLEGWKA